MNKVFIDILPINTTGRYKNKINWVNSVGQIIHFIYEDIEGDLKIIEYIRRKNKKPLLKINYNNCDFLITIDDLKKCALGKILNKITNDFKIEIGTIFKDDKRDITIIDRKYKKSKRNQNMKYYKYKCNKCGFDENWAEESHLRLHNQGCSCCSGRIIVKGINDIATTNPELVKYFVDTDNCYKYSNNSCNSTLMKCPYCNFKRKMRIIDLKRNGFSCPRCGDRISYPEKVMFNMLLQLKENNQIEDFIYQYSKTNNSWCDKYRYDFYFELNDEKYIIETHGLQHYKDKFYSLSGETLEEIKQNDKNKKELAIQNKIKSENYIVINCSESNLEYIKNNITHSKLNKIFNLNSIDWNKCEKYSLKNYVKTICEYKNNNTNATSTEIAILFKKSTTTIIKYLKIGAKLGWCNYDPKEESKKTVENNVKLIEKICGKRVEIFKDGQSLGIFPSCHELERQSEKLFGVKLSFKKISAVCLGNEKQHKGYTFKYI